MQETTHTLVKKIHTYFESIHEVSRAKRCPGNDADLIDLIDDLAGFWADLCDNMSVGLPSPTNWNPHRTPVFHVGDVVDVEYKAGGAAYTYVRVSESEWSSNPAKEVGKLTSFRMEAMWACNQVIVRKYQGEWLPSGLRPNERSW